MMGKRLVFYHFFPVPPLAPFQRPVGGAMFRGSRNSQTKRWGFAILGSVLSLKITKTPDHFDHFLKVWVAFLLKNFHFSSFNFPITKFSHDFLPPFFLHISLIKNHDWHCTAFGHVSMCPLRFVAWQECNRDLEEKLGKQQKLLQRCIPLSAPSAVYPIERFWFFFLPSTPQGQPTRVILRAKRFKGFFIRHYFTRVVQAIPASNGVKKKNSETPFFFEID